MKRILFVLSAILILAFASFALATDAPIIATNPQAEEEFVGGIGADEAELLEGSLRTLDGRIIDAAYLAELEREGGMNRVVGQMGEKDQVVTANGVITPTAVPNPPSPITSRLIEELGAWPHIKSLGLDINNQLCILVGEKGGPGQYWEFYFKYIDWQDGTRTNYNNRHVGAYPYLRGPFEDGFQWWAFPTGVTYNPAAPYASFYFTVEAWWGKPWVPTQTPQSIYMGARIDYVNP